MDTETDDDGATMLTVDYETAGVRGLDYEGLSVEVSEEDGEVRVRIFRYLVGGQAVAPHSLVGSAAEGMPLPVGWSVQSSEAGIADYGSGARVSIRVVALVPEPAPAAGAVLDEAVAHFLPGGWEPGSPSSSGQSFSAEDRHLYVSVYDGTSETTVTYSAS